jgi:hypothetical protein
MWNLNAFVQHVKLRFTDGLVLGGKDALQELFEATRDYFGPKRKTGRATLYCR